MATTATTTTTSAAASTYVCRRQLTSFGRSFSNSYVSFTRKPTVKFVSVRCSSDDVATSTEETEIEVPKGPPSLISALNAERAIRGVGMILMCHCVCLCSYDLRYIVKLTNVV